MTNEQAGVGARDVKKIIRGQGGKRAREEEDKEGEGRGGGPLENACLPHRTQRTKNPL